MIWARSLGLIVDSFLPVLIEPSTAEVSNIGSDASTRVWVATLLHVAIAAAIMAVAWYATSRVRPYFFRFQNALVRGLSASHLPRTR